MALLPFLLLSTDCLSKESLFRHTMTSMLFNSLNYSFFTCFPSMAFHPMLLPIVDRNSSRIFSGLSEKPSIWNSISHPDIIHKPMVKQNEQIKLWNSIFVVMSIISKIIGRHSFLSRNLLTTTRLPLLPEFHPSLRTRVIIRTCQFTRNENYLPHEPVNLLLTLMPFIRNSVTKFPKHKNAIKQLPTKIELWLWTSRSVNKHTSKRNSFALHGLQRNLPKSSLALILSLGKLAQTRSFLNFRTICALFIRFSMFP